jgi:hypothetical protein
MKKKMGRLLFLISVGMFALRDGQGKVYFAWEADLVKNLPYSKLYKS